MLELFDLFLFFLFFYMDTLNFSKINFVLYVDVILKVLHFQLNMYASAFNDGSLFSLSVCYLARIMR